MIMLSVVLPTPLKVNAVSEDDTKKLYIIGTIASYAGINIDLDAVLERFPNFLDDIMSMAQDIYDDLALATGWNDAEGASSRDQNNAVVFTRDLQSYLDSLALGLFPYNPVSQIVNYKFILSVVRAIARWCENNLGGGSSESGGNDSFGTVSVSDDIIDFYTQGSITLTLPDYDASKYNIVHFYLNDCTIDIHINIPEARERALKGLSASGYSESPDINVCDAVIIPNDADIIAFHSCDFNSSSMSGKTLSNYASNSSSFDVIFRGYYDISIFDAYSTGTKFIANNHVYYIRPYNGGYSFVDLYDDSIVYNSNLVFDTKFDAAKWFWNLCGIDITPSQPSVYASSATSPVVIDNDTVTQTITTVTNYINNDNSTTSMIFPSYYITNNYYNYDDYRQHPEYIFDFDQERLYNSSLALPSYDGNKLANKFPFCIPFDIYHLFSNFVAEPEAPQFHWLVLPANSFGMTNEAFYIDLDFTPYNFLVQLMRFFIAVAFTLWLMTKTKDLMQ